MQICRRFALSPRAVCFGLVVGLASLLLAGCGQSTGPTAGVATPTWTPFVMPTPKPTNTPRPMGSLCSGPGDFQGPFQSPVATAGDLSFEAMSSAVMYPQLKLPDGQPLKPLQVGGAISSADTAHYPLANVTMYRLTVCNTSKTAAHTIASMNIKVNSFVAYASQLNVTQVCALVYSRQGTTGNGCGGAQGADLLLRATLGSSAVGTTAQVTADGLQSAPLATLEPGYMISALMTINPPSTPGIYSYKVGLAVDGAATVYPVPATTAILQAPVAHMWDGAACTTSDMQAQIPPATEPPTYYICPKM